jgi:hypothetical protein
VPQPVARRSRALVVVAGLALAVTAAACSTPKTAAGTQAQGRTRVLSLIDEMRGAVPNSTVASTTPHSSGLVPCKRKVLGYAAGSTGAQRVEAPAIVQLHGDKTQWLLSRQGPQLARAALAPIEARWRAAGYQIDRSGLSNTRFPKIAAHVDGYEAVATGWADLPQLTLYAESPCLKA